MPRTVYILFFILSLSLSAFGGLLPLTVKEIALMLRSGYSIEAVEEDLTARHFIETIDPTAEKALLEAGAPPAFVASLKSGRFAVPPEKTTALAREVEAKAKHRAAMEAEAKKFNTLYQDQMARERTAAAPSSASSGALARLVKGELVTSKNGTLSTYNDQELERKKLIALYFSARWCGPCRKFTPDLVAYYNRVAASHPEFEIIFVSQDRSAPAMEEYMRDMQMPWPALRYDNAQQNNEILAYAGDGIPCLVLLDGDGKVVSHSYNGKTYLGPGKVLADLDRIFGLTPPEAVAQRK